MSPGHDERASNERHQFERLVFFSDAVFAIAITLLVLDLRLPPSVHGTIDLDSIEPKLLGFGLSFFVIGLYWLGHHRLFGGLMREDALLRVVNLVFLATVVFLPFPTSVIAELHASTASVSLYAASVAAVGIMLTVLILVARRPSLLRPGETSGGTGRWVAHTVVAPAVFLVSILIAQSSPRAAMESWWLVAAANVLIGRITRRRR